MADPVMPGGANRDKSADKPANWCTLEYESVRALAETNFEGDTHYGLDNWMKGLPASDLINHAMEHLFKLVSGDALESHLEHAMWNLGKLRWMARNRPDLIDLPRVRKALGLDLTESTQVPNDHHPERNTNCFYCGQGIGKSPAKVIPVASQFKQAHVSCHGSASDPQRDKFYAAP